MGSLLFKGAHESGALFDAEREHSLSGVESASIRLRWLLRSTSSLLPAREARVKGASLPCVLPWGWKAWSRLASLSKYVLCTELGGSGTSSKDTGTFRVHGA